MSGTAAELSAPETRDLQACEDIIQHGLKSFVRVGEALMKIRDEKLYRDAHGTFEAYCKERWNFTSSRARQLIGGAATVKRVRNAAEILPTSERQARELSRVPLDKQASIWKEAIATAADGNPTALHIRKIAGSKNNDTRQPIARGNAVHIYFIECESTGAIKIGRSNNPHMRLQELQTGCPHKLRLLGTFRDATGGNSEGVLHQAFGHLRISGEWFRGDNELRLYIAKKITCSATRKSSIGLNSQGKKS